MMKNILDYDKLFDESGKQMIVCSEGKIGGNYMSEQSVNDAHNKIRTFETADIGLSEAYRCLYETLVMTPAPLHCTYVDNSFNFENEDTEDGKHKIFSNLSLFAIAILSIIAIAIII